MLVTPTVVLVALSLAIGIFAEPALGAVRVAASQAIDRAGYIQTVNPQPMTTDLAVGQEQAP